MITAGGLIRGQPRPSSEFREISWAHYVHELEKSIAFRTRKATKERPRDASSEAELPFRAVTTYDDGPDEPVLTLADALLSFAGRSDGMKLAVVRVPLFAISSWWIAGGSYIEADSDHGGFIGGFFTTGD